jgi:hypothetical protein
VTVGLAVLAVGALGSEASEQGRGGRQDVDEVVGHRLVIDWAYNGTGLVLTDRVAHDSTAGLRMPESDAEIVVQTERPELEANLTVTSADDAAVAISRAGGRVIVEAFDIPIGRCAVVEDPWGNRLVVLDTSRGRLVTE